MHNSLRGEVENLKVRKKNADLAAKQMVGELMEMVGKKPTFEEELANLKES